MKEHIALLVDERLPVPPFNRNPTIIVQNEEKHKLAAA